jgi:hypothetical protein
MPWKTWEEGQFRIAEQTKIANEQKQETKYKRSFIYTFPNIPWAHIIKQDDYLETDDSCTHFMDVITGLFYEWNFYEDEWRSHGNDMASMFDASRVLAYKNQLQH